MIKVLIVDDHAIVRRGLVEILARVGDMTVVGEASDGSSALKFIRRELPDVILLDIALPDQSGLEILKRSPARSCQAQHELLAGRRGHPVEEIRFKAMDGKLWAFEIVAGQGCNGQVAQPAQFSNKG